MTRLVITRRAGERFRIGDAVVQVVAIERDHKQVRIAVEAPPEVRIEREELHLKELP